MKTIILDPGHGGISMIDGSAPIGATSPSGVKEKDLTLRIAMKVVSEFVGTEYRLAVTRYADCNLGLQARAQTALVSKADCFVSIHFNGFKDSSTQGTETFFHDASPQSKEFASKVHKRILAATGHIDRGIKHALLQVLSPAYLGRIPACLVEISFITDPKEDERLKSGAYQNEIAKAIKDGIIDFFNR